MIHHVVGKPSGKLEGIGKVSGEARYSAEATLPGLCWGKVLRSPLPHARIRINVVGDWLRGTLDPTLGEAG